MDDKIKIYLEHWEALFNSGYEEPRIIVVLRQARERIENLESALRKIADIDYRGNSHPSKAIALDALKGKRHG
jgi:hypothetical protein